MASSSNRNSDYIAKILTDESISSEEKAKQVGVCFQEWQEFRAPLYKLLKQHAENKNASAHMKMLAAQLEQLVNEFCNTTVEGRFFQGSLLHIAAAWGGKPSVEVALSHISHHIHTMQSFYCWIQESRLEATPVVAALKFKQFETVTYLLDHYSSPGYLRKAVPLEREIKLASPVDGEKDHQWGAELSATFRGRDSSLLDIALELFDSSVDGEKRSFLLSLFNYKHKLPIADFPKLKDWVAKASKVSKISKDKDKDKSWANCSGFQYLAARSVLECAEKRGDICEEIVKYFVKDPSRLVDSKDEHMAERRLDCANLIAFIKEAIRSNTLAEPFPDSKLKQLPGEYLGLRGKLIYAFRELRGDREKICNLLCSLQAAAEAVLSKLKLPSEQAQVLCDTLNGKAPSVHVPPMPVPPISKGSGASSGSPSIPGSDVELLVCSSSFRFSGGAGLPGRVPASSAATSSTISSTTNNTASTTTQTAGPAKKV